jgi:dephospho-CoA kinase
MRIIGVTGPPGSGKTTVSQHLERLGACVILADQIAQELLDDPDMIKRIGHLFGRETVADGRVDRNALGNIVFADRDALSKLNQLVHPRLLNTIRRRVEENRSLDCEVTVIDAALIVEWGIEESMDLVLYVHAPESECIERLLSRPGMTRAKARGIIEAQLPSSRKRNSCDVTIDNSGCLNETLRQVDLLWERLDQEVEDAGRS